MAEILTATFAFLGMMAGYLEQQYLFTKTAKKNRYQ